MRDSVEPLWPPRRFRPRGAPTRDRATRRAGRRAQRAGIIDRLIDADTAVRDAASSAFRDFRGEWRQVT